MEHLRRAGSGSRAAHPADLATISEHLGDLRRSSLVSLAPITEAASLYPNWIESRHVPAPAPQSKSGESESATQERE